MLKLFSLILFFTLKSPCVLPGDVLTLEINVEMECISIGADLWKKAMK